MAEPSKERFGWELEASELLEVLRDGVIIVDAAENRIVAWNTAAEQIFGYSPEEAIGMSVSELAPERLRPRHEAGIARFATTGEGYFVDNHDPLELPALTKAGEEIFVEFQLSPIRRPPHEPPYAAAIVRDVTPRVQEAEAQKQLQEIASATQRLEAVGGLATGAAHDFNNLLTVITTRIDLLLEAQDLGREEKETLQAVMGAAERGASLARQMLAFASKSVVTPAAVSLNEALTNAANFLGATLGPGIHLELQLTEDLPRTMIDPVQVDQILVNFALNAKDAMPNGGKLTIGTDLKTVAVAPPPRRPSKITPGVYVRVLVRDTGIGMDEDIRRRIFEPFFTTKPRGRGTGMGLAMVYGIVAQAGGHIHCESAPGDGALFEILLPAASIKEDHYLKEKEIAPVVTKRGEILLVDDDPALLGSVTQILERGGHHVVSASSAEEALRIVEGGHSFDILVSDIVMPGKNGIELARELRRRGVIDAVILMSGYPEGALPQGLGQLDSEDMTFLQKPFTREGMLKHVADLTGAGSTPDPTGSAEGPAPRSP